MARERREASQIRERAERIRRELKLVAARGASPASFLPRVRRANRRVRKGDLDGALRVLELLENQLVTQLRHGNA